MYTYDLAIPEFKATAAEAIGFSRRFMPKFATMNLGDVIIEEGSREMKCLPFSAAPQRSMQVCVRVGQIHDSETFGAISVLTGMKRTATVKAETPCTIVVATKENYKDLLASQPDAVIKLVEDMTRVIVSNNNRIVKLTKELASKD